MGVDAVRRPRAGARDAELGIAEDDVGRNGAVGEDAAGAVDVVDEGVDRHALCSRPCRQIGPFAGGEDARDDVERDDPLGRVLVAIDGEGDAEAAEGGFGGLLAAVELGRGHVGEPAREQLEARPPSCGGWFPTSSSKARASVTRPSQMPDAASYQGPRDQSGRRRTGPRGQAGREAPKKTGARWCGRRFVQAVEVQADLGRLDLVGLAQDVAAAPDRLDIILAAAGEAQFFRSLQMNTSMISSSGSSMPP